MNPDLMITIVFSLWVLLAWGALGMLFVRSVRNEKTEEADAKRLDPARESAVSIGQPGPTKSCRRTAALERCGGLRISTAASRQTPSRAPHWCCRRREVRASLTISAGGLDRHLRRGNGCILAQRGASLEQTTCAVSASLSRGLRRQDRPAK
jgi:hypothetical protein